MKKYNLDLVAATFIILDSNEASMQVSLIDHLWKASLYRLFFFKLFLPIFANKGFFYLENLLVKVALIGCDLFSILVPMKNERNS